MRTKDWKPTKPAKILVIGEDSNLQWSDSVEKYVMFADYYFRDFPEDHGERSRNVEAQNLFAHIRELTAGRYKSDEIYLTNLCNEQVENAPKGKRVFIPEEMAKKGMEHIEWILSANPAIEWILPMSLQTNYWLQHFGFYGDMPDFLQAAEPRRNGINSQPPYYQPVDGKAFTLVCGRIFSAKGATTAKVIPILQAKDYPLHDRNLEQFGEVYNEIATYFKNM